MSPQNLESAPSEEVASLEQSVREMLTPERIAQAQKEGKLTTVWVKRDNGLYSSEWQVFGINDETDRAVVYRKGTTKSKQIEVEDLVASCVYGLRTDNDTPEPVLSESISACTTLSEFRLALMSSGKVRSGNNVFPSAYLISVLDRILGGGGASFALFPRVGGIREKATELIER